jgi:ketosteroid isomerase-like protein
MESDILALEDTRYAAMTANDLVALEALLHDDLIYTHSSAAVDTKASWLESLRSGKTRYRKATRTDQKVRFFGDVALVTGRATLEVEVNGQPRALNVRFLNAWTMTPQGWRFAAWQSTPIPAA